MSIFIYKKDRGYLASDAKIDGHGDYLAAFPGVYAGLGGNGRRKFDPQELGRFVKRRMGSDPLTKPLLNRI